MQNVPSTDLGAAGKIEFAGLSRFSAVSMSSTLFSSFMNYDAGLESSTNTGLDDAWQGVLPRADEAAVRTDAAQTATQTANRAATSRTATENSRNTRAAEAETRAAETDDADDDDTDEIEDMKNVAVDPDVLAALLPKLQKYGLSDEDAATLTQRAKSDAGLTWGQLVDFVAEKTGNQLGGLNLSDGQKQNYLTMFQKAGFSSADAEKLLARLQNGDVDGVTSALKNKLAALDTDTLSAQDREALSSLADDLAQLKGRTEAQSTGLVRSIADSMHTALDKYRAQLLGQGVSQAAEGEATVNTSVAEAAQYDPTHKVVDRKTALANAGKMIENMDSSEQAGLANDRIRDAAAEQLSMSGDKTADQFMQQDDAARDQAGRKSDQAWSEFTARLRQDAAGSGQSITAEALDALAGKDALAQVQTATSGRSTAQTQTQTSAKLWQNTNAPRLLEQVQDGILKNMSNGQKQLTLRLDPAELGQMTLIIKASGKEISATIRAENPQAAQTIAENLDQVRQALEDQGLKVAKLEVQTQLAGQENGSQWQGEAQHNQARDEEEMARNRSRWRVLRGEGGETSTAAAVDTAAAAVRLGSGQGLHLIA